MKFSLHKNRESLTGARRIVVLVAILSHLAGVALGEKAELAGLIKRLTTRNAQVRREAIADATRMHSRAISAVNALEMASKSSDASIKHDAALALGEIARTDLAMVMFVQSLGSSKTQNDAVDDSPDEGMVIVRARMDIALSALMEILRDEGQDVSIRAEAARSLERLEPEGEARLRQAGLHRMVIETLIRDLKKHSDIQVRWESAGALGDLGREDNDNVARVLIEVLDAADGKAGEKEPRVIYRVVDALGKLKSEIAVKVLTERLNKTGGAAEQRIRVAAARSLGSLRPTGDEAVLSLNNAAKERQGDLCSNAATALGFIGAPASKTIPVLRDVAQSPDFYCKEAAAEALGRIAKDMAEKGSMDSFDELIKARDELSLDPKTSKFGLEVSNALESLLARQPWIDRQIRWAEQHRLLVLVRLVLLLYFGLAALCMTLFFASPFRLVTVNERLKSVGDYTFKIGGNEIPIKLRYFLLFGLFHYRRRVLNSWVNWNIQTVRRNFSKLDAVRDLSTYVAVPIQIDGEFVAGNLPSDLRLALASTDRYVLVAGESGSGKTSLAFQIAHHVMSISRAARMNDYCMLPVLIGGFELRACKNVGDLKDTVYRNLKALLDKPLSEQWLGHLQRERRVLVIIDQASNLNEDTREAVVRYAADLPPQSVIVTSRTELASYSVPRTLIQMQRLKAKEIPLFLDKYLDGRKNLTDVADLKACMLKVVGERTVPIGFVKLLVDNFIGAEDRLGAPGCASGIPELMIQYLNGLNGRARIDQANEPDDLLVQKAVKIVAWECLRKDYYLSESTIETLSVQLTRMQLEASSLLMYLEDRLQLIRRTTQGRDTVQFTIAPLAEYLAALHLVRMLGANQRKWEAVLTAIEARLKKEEKVKWFLVALKESCALRDSGLRVPARVVDKINALIETHFESVGK